MTSYLIRLPVNPGLRDVLALFGKSDILVVGETNEYSTFELAKTIYKQIKLPIKYKDAKEIIVRQETPDEPVFTDFVKLGDDSETAMACFDAAFTKHVQSKLEKLFNMPGNVYLIELDEAAGDAILSNFVKLSK